LVYARTIGRRETDASTSQRQPVVIYHKHCM
jgi:hypothetical protein